MATALVTYLHDRLAGARFAVSLLEDLSVQTVDADTAVLAASLLSPIRQDRAVVESLLADLGEDPSALKEAAAWLTQKASRLKLTLSNPEGIFEAVELLTLGVLGKLALWNTLRTLEPLDMGPTHLDLAALCAGAESQHAALEALRRRLAIKAFAAASRSSHNQDVPASKA
jgi:hypothetical protein